MDIIMCSLPKSPTVEAIVVDSEGTLAQRFFLHVEGISSRDGRMYFNGVSDESFYINVLEATFDELYELLYLPPDDNVQRYDELGKLIHVEDDDNYEPRKLTEEELNEKAKIRSQTKLLWLQG